MDLVTVGNGHRGFGNCGMFIVDLVTVENDNHWKW